MSSILLTHSFSDTSKELSVSQASGINSTVPIKHDGEYGNLYLVDIPQNILKSGNLYWSAYLSGQNVADIFYHNDYSYSGNIYNKDWINTFSGNIDTRIDALEGASDITWLSLATVSSSAISAFNWFVESGVKLSTHENDSTIHFTIDSIRDDFTASSNVNRSLIDSISSNIDNRVDSLYDWSSNALILYGASSHIHSEFGLWSGATDFYSVSSNYFGHSSNSDIHFPSSQLLSWFNSLYQESGTSSTEDVAWSGAQQFYSFSSNVKQNIIDLFNTSSAFDLRLDNLEDNDEFNHTLYVISSNLYNKLWIDALSGNIDSRIDALESDTFNHELYIISSTSIERFADSSNYSTHKGDSSIHFTLESIQDDFYPSSIGAGLSGSYSIHRQDSTIHFTKSSLDDDYQGSSQAIAKFADSSNVKLRFPGSSNINRDLLNSISSNLDLRIDSLFDYSSNAKNLYADSGNIRFRFLASTSSFTTNWTDLTDGGETSLHTHAGMTTDVAWSGASQFYSFSSNTKVYIESLVAFSSNADELFLGSGVSEINELFDVDTQTTSPSRDQVLKWNGSNWVPAAYDDTFEFTIASFSDEESTTQLIGIGIFQAQDSMSFTATYNNGPPDVSLVFVGYNSTNYYKSGVVGEMTSPNYTAGTNSSLDVSYPAAKDQYLRFLLSSNSGTDKDTYAETAIYFRNYVYYGVLSKSESFSEADIEGLTSALTNSYTTSRTINAGAGEHLIIAYPESYTTIHADGFKFNSITCPFSSAASVSITNSAGYTENYRVHPSKLPGLGNSTLSLSTSATIINYLYYGITLKTDTFTEADIEGLANSEVTNDNTQTWDSVTAGVGEYLLFAFPTRLGTVTFYVGGFEGGFEDPETVSVTNVNGYPEDYYVWRSTNSNLGATVVVTS